MRGKKKTFLVKIRQDGLFWEQERMEIENDLSILDIIDQYISLKDVEHQGPDAISFFVVQRWVGSRKRETECHIGEIYTRDRIASEFGTNSSLYRNVVNNNYSSAIKYINGNFGGIYRDSIVFSQQDIIDIVSNVSKNQEEITQ